MKNIFDSYFESFFKDMNNLTQKGFEKSAKFYYSFYKEFLPEDKNAKILDIGCGLGQFLYFLEKQGYKNYYGIDVSEQQIKFCQDKVTKKVETTDIFGFLKGKKEQFDLVVANDVLEHIPKGKLFEILELVHQSLKPEAKFFAKVPNMSNPFGLMDRYSDFTHEIGFTEFSLREVLVMSGFKIIKIKGAAYPLISLKSVAAKILELPFYIFLRMMFRIQGHIAPKIMDKDIISITKK